jgi:hypothetical protein
MIVSHEHEFIFVKTRKTAGTSIECALADRMDDTAMITPISPADEALRQRGPQNYDGFKNHSTLKSALKVWKGYYTFAVERNPFDRHISAYYWGNQNGGPGVNDWMPNSRVRSNWDQYATGGRIEVDFLGRYCHLQEDLDYFCERVGLPTLVLPRAKGNFRTNREHYSKVLNTKTRERIEKACRREIEALDWCRWSEDND